MDLSGAGQAFGNRGRNDGGELCTLSAIGGFFTW